MGARRWGRTVAAVLLSAACILGLASCGVAGQNEPLTLDSLRYDVAIQPNGDMLVSETWKVAMETREDTSGDTRPWHQLFRTFKDRPNVYDGITDVSVRDADRHSYRQTDLADPENVPEDQYEALAGTYYLTKTGTDTTELGWNIPPTDSGRATYYVSYRVKNAITRLSDGGAEFNWQFLDSSNGIYAQQVNGEITIPTSVQRQQSRALAKDDVRAWLHFEHSPSELTIGDDGVIRFHAEPMPAQMPLEVHATFPAAYVENAKRSSGKTSGDIAAAEQRMADAWQAKVQSRNHMTIALCAASLILMLAMLAWTVWAIRTSRRLARYRGDMTYWRDDPGVSPAVAAKLIAMGGAGRGADRNGMAATMLSLAHKRWIGLTMRPAGQYGAQDVLITLREPARSRAARLAGSEQALYAVLQRAGAGYRRPFTMNDLEQAGKADYVAFDGLFAGYRDQVAMEYGAGHYTTTTQRYTVVPCAVTIGIGMLAMLGFIALDWPLLAGAVITTAIVLCVTVMAKAKSETLTPEGNLVAGRLEGLKRYMLDFSDFSKRGVPDLAMWDFYLVYAAAFGISDQVIRQLHALYPQLRDPAFMDGTWDSSPVVYSTFHHSMAGGAGPAMSLPDLGQMLSGNFNDIQSAVTELAHPSTSSSGGGFGGGGFSGSSGGGGGGGMGGR
ncbi:DUF2207 domain-containing protein [Bifidobacterium sp. 82T24]|uniref:DUF2207 domain-containing protein n=1 Tax=Bifidobacterium pluvialisilvae TaxID=2834436 RepID=UPI001C563460|nr:DUF2207 domain-containing protein [Bifidobacterium pluvialisilvae]MBW3088773.1 DUF2207 domain-containing protein [Bifidobacterium pluvialisilvae]